jgi:D-alanyl-D-alanine carboxypeptidase
VKVARLLLAGAVVAALAGCSSSDDESLQTVERPDFQKSLRELAQSSSAAAVALVQTESELWRGAAGDAERTRPAIPDDRFGIASTTKTFVATVVLQLVGEDRLSLDDTVERRLPGLLREGRRVTVRQLLNHTAGLENGFPGQSARARVAEIDAYALEFRPGTMHRYSNMNYVVLGLIVEKLTGQGLAQALRDRIFRPLGLDDTGYGPVRPKRGDARTITWLGVPMDFAGPVTGDGGIVSTVADLARFHQALFGGELLRSELLAEITRTVATDEGGVRAGLGIFQLELSCGTAWGHGGDQVSYSDMPLVAGDGSKVVIVAQNTTGWYRARDLAAELFCS